MKITIENNEIVIRAPLNATPPVSSTGKSLLLVNTGGYYKPGLQHNDKAVSVSLNVIVPNKP